MHKRKYIKGIDGLRAIAVLGVILYHLVPQWVPGGFLGVPLFFVISGYLMTDILLYQWENRQKIKIKDFYFRRIKRIYPSLIVLFIITGSIFVFISKKYLLNFRQVVLTSILNVNNWWQISNGLSYFDRFANESPFTHLWSLSIEGQFYIFWPIILAFILYKVKDYKLINRLILFVTGISAMLMIVFYTPEMINRIYYGGDTRIFSVLLGASLAFSLRNHHEKIARIHIGTKVAIFILGMFTLIASLFLLTDNSTFVYRGGMLLFSIVATVVLGVIVDVDLISDNFTSRVIRWIGSRSYEIYLWQLPVMVVYNDQIKWDGANVLLHGVIQLLIIGLLSEGTYRVVRQITNVGSVKDFYVKVKMLFSKNTPALIVVSLFICTFLVGLAIAPSGKMESAVALQKKLEENKKVVEQHNKKIASSEQTTTSSSVTTSSTENSTTSSSTKETNELPKTGEGLTQAQKDKVAKISLGAVGDSVLLSAAPELQTYFPKSHIDAEVGRQLADSPKVFGELKKEDNLGDVVLVVLGTNGSFKDSDIDKIMKEVGDRQAYFVNTLVDRPWQASVNETLEKTSKKYDNAHLIDWKSYAEGHREWFDEDGIHLVPEGGEKFSELVATEILKDL